MKNIKTLLLVMTTILLVAAMSSLGTAKQSVPVEGETFRYVEWDETSPTHAFAYCPGYERGAKVNYVVSCNLMSATKMWDCRLIPRVNKVKAGVSARDRNVAGERACARIPQ